MNDLLADARAREVAATLAKFREDEMLLAITEQEVQRALAYGRAARLPAKRSNVAVRTMISVLLLRAKLGSIQQGESSRVNPSAAR